MTLSIGQRVQCTDDSPGDDKRYPQYRLELNRTYTVSFITSHKGVPVIQVAEHNLPAGFYWRADRFRAVRTTDISIFKNILLPNSEAVS